MNLFPYKEIRQGQEKLLKRAETCLKNKKCLIAHAPTGIGKTAAVLTPALKIALEYDLNVFFLTSRHTQHKIVIDTVNKIPREVTAVDIIGKKWMCALDGLERMSSGDFAEFCRNQRKKGKCVYYNNTREGNGLSKRAENLIASLSGTKALHAEELKIKVKNQELCPYEISVELAKSSRLVIADYSYIFEPGISEKLFLKLEKPLEKSIIIIDEAHNLPNRLRDMLSDTLSLYIINNAIKEAKENGFNEIRMNVEMLKGFLTQSQKEQYVKKDVFEDFVRSIKGYDEFVDELDAAAAIIREKKERSWLGSIARFLELWKKDYEGTVRILKPDEKNTSLMIKNLNPGILSKPVIEKAYSVIMMSGTLNNMEMFRDLLGFDESTELLELQSPFPKENQLSLIVPIVSTSYKRRTMQEFKKIGYAAGYLSSIINGNVMLFFPSYKLLHDVKPFFEEHYDKRIFIEKRNMSKQEKQELLRKFSAERGSSLLAVISGSFAEGIDLPGELLKAVIVVGVPFSVPDLETKALIDFYERKFGKGNEYGYVYPAIIKVLQSAGRVIRSETDRGIIVLLDERYSYPGFFKYLPKEWDFKITRDFESFINDFQ